MIDYGHIETEKEIALIEKRLRKEYAQAEKEVQAKLDDYLRRFEIKDKKWRQWVKSGEKTAKEYKQWRIGQIAVGKRWEDMRDAIAQDYVNINQIARSIVKGEAPEVYAINHNFATYQIEHDARVNTSYTLYSRETVERLVRDNSEVLPAPGKATSQRILNGLDVRWNRQQLQSVLTQAILQGESIPNMAKRLANEVGDRNYKAAVRNARTMMTGAQNAGRLNAYKRAEGMGIELSKTWVATLDGRTRHAHRQLDGQSVKTTEPFESEFGEIMYPGDPSADPANVYNCRCTMISSIKGFEIDTTAARNDLDIGDMTYEEWKNEHKAAANRITLQEEKGEAIRMSYISRYRK